MKKVALKPKSQATSPDDWVSAGTEKSEIAPQSAVVAAIAKSAGDESVTSFKRLTIDIPNELHTRIKVQCAARGRKMADEIRALLEEHFVL